MTEWEYFTAADEAELPTLGRQGWELVAVVNRQGLPVFYLKRPAESFRDRVTREQKQAFYRTPGLREEPTP